MRGAEMDKKRIISLCEQILAATDKVVSVGTAAAQINGTQLSGVQRAVRLIAEEVTKPEEVEQDG